DRLPEEYVAVLSQLHDQVPPQPFAVVEREVVRETGRSLADAFSDFDPEPLAAASLAQVHRARLRDGREVAVKVQYPDIQRVIGMDLDNIAVMAWVLGKLERGMDFRPLVNQLRFNVTQELDFVHEADNADRLREIFATREDIVIPRIVRELTTRRVLVLEFIPGVKITDREAMEAQGIPTHEVLRLLVEAYGEQILGSGFFHGDPHPGNLMALPGPRLAFVDFGLAATLTPAFRRGLVQLTQALVLGDIPGAVASFRLLGFQTRTEDPETLAQLGRIMLGLDGTARDDKLETMAAAHARLARLMRHNPVTYVPPEVLLVARVLGLLNGLGQQLNSQVNIFQTILPYAVRALQAPVEPAGA
ncbi:MAG TPA: AarF/ABC1/UbiB kinase family protein, partial [Dehalococcoidia bacterium]